MAINNIRYICNSNMGIELVFCENSTISYPTHNHISVLTIGIVLDGSILLTTDDKVSFYEKNQTFLICPYMPHSISAHSSYTLLSLCIDKNIAAHYSTNKIRSNIMALLMSSLNTEKINQYQILQLLNCLNLITAYTNWHSESQNPFINHLKKQLEVALTTGFCDQSHFIKQFEKQVGLPPLTYKLSSQTMKQKEMR